MFVAEEGTTTKVIAVHSFSGDTTRIEMRVGDQWWSIDGRATGLLPLGTHQTIELAHVHATPSAIALSEDAPDLFFAAIQTLVERGTEFYTVLRQSWALPAVRWHSPRKIDKQ